MSKRKKQHMVFVDVWYTDDQLPDVFQSYTWQTVDQGPEFPRAMGFVADLAQTVKIHHVTIREFKRKIPKFKPGLARELVVTTQ